MEASITATVFHLQEFRFLPHAVEVFALLGHLHCTASQKERATFVYLSHTEQYQPLKCVAVKWGPKKFRNVGKQNNGL